MLLHAAAILAVVAKASSILPVDALAMKSSTTFATSATRKRSVTHACVPHVLLDYCDIHRSNNSYGFCYCYYC